MRIPSREKDEARFWSKIDRQDDGCWLWTCSTLKGGYGLSWWGGKYLLAHRAAYELLVGPVPEGMQLDHLCRVRACVNPAHLEPVTPRENVLRGATGPAANAVKTHCKRGHPLEGENLGHHSKTGARFCRECKRVWERNKRVRLAR